MSTVIVTDTHILLGDMKRNNSNDEPDKGNIAEIFGLAIASGFDKYLRYRNDGTLTELPIDIQSYDIDGSCSIHTVKDDPVREAGLLIVIGYEDYQDRLVSMGYSLTASSNVMFKSLETDPEDVVKDNIKGILGTDTGEDIERLMFLGVPHTLSSIVIANDMLSMTVMFVDEASTDVVNAIHGTPGVSALSTGDPLVVLIDISGIEFDGDYRKVIENLNRG